MPFHGAKKVFFVFRPARPCKIATIGDVSACGNAVSLPYEYTELLYYVPPHVAFALFMWSFHSYGTADRDYKKRVPRYFLFF